MTEAGQAVEQRSNKYRIAGMDCGDCAITIESSIRQLPGVETATVSFTNETMEVAGDVGANAIEHRLNELGYRLVKDDLQVGAKPPGHRGLRGFIDFLWGHPTLRRAMFVAGAVLIGVVVLIGRPPIAGIEPIDLLFATAVFISGSPVFLKGIRAAFFARRITIDLLMAVAAAGALAIGATGEAVTVILLFVLGEALEAYSAERARDSLRSLIALQPQEATVLKTQNDGAHDYQTVVPIDQVNVGDRVLIRPGQRVPLDGNIIEGTSSINQAPVTGENMPVVKSVGDEVMAGTVNGEAALEISVTKIAADGTIARIAKLVEQAHAKRSPAERYIDRFARWYTPAVVVLAALVVAIPVLAFGQPLLDTADSAPGWLYRGLAMLIIACPCALVISIPVAVVSGLTRLANLGVLVKDGAHLDRLADIQVVAFDKTGTLTHGRPRVTDVLTGDCEHPPVDDADCDSCDDVVGDAAAVERASEHPVAAAIIDAAETRRAKGDIETAQSIHAHPGRGVSGNLDSGVTVSVGNQNLFDANMDGWEAIAPYAENAQFDGQTVIYVARDNKLIGYIGVRDEVRNLTGDSLQALEDMDPPVSTVMLTGDTPQSAKRVVDEIGGIDQVRAGLLPDEKLRAIEELRVAMGPIAMVGDGINDAPALARADVGIAMGGGGTAQAMETADVVLMQDDLSHVPMTLQMARKSRRVIKENIALSLGLKLAFLALAIPGLATLWMAVLADVGTTLVVTLNGMRLLRS